jgi:hypothetical protein
MARERGIDPASQLGRQLSARDAGPSAVAAVVAGVAGLAAFVASLLLDWLRMTASFNQYLNDNEGTVTQSNVVTTGVAPAPFGVAYQVGVLALLALLASVVLRPDLAARLRLAVTALGLGVAATVVATLLQLRRPIDIAVSSSSGMVLSKEYLPGVYCAAGAVVALVAGVWLAAAPGAARRSESTRTASGPSPLARVVGSQGPVVTFAAGVGGAGLLVVSMVVAWQRVSGGPPTPSNAPATTPTNSPLMLADTWSGVVYLLGVLALLGFLGAVAARPDLAARLRMAAVGLALGTGGAVVGTAFEMRRATASRYLLGLYISDQAQQVEGLKFSIEPGIYAAGGVLIALAGGIWLAGAVPASVPSYVVVPATQTPPVPMPAVPTSAVPVPEAPVSPAPVSGAPPISAPAPATRMVSGPAVSWLDPVGYADGLTVSASEPIDIGGPGDILRG